MSIYSEDVDATKVYPIIHMIKQACLFCLLLASVAHSEQDVIVSFPFLSTSQPHREGTASNFDVSLLICTRIT